VVVELTRHSAYLGTLAFMTNIIREMSALVLIPVVVKKLGGLEAAGMSGTSAMSIALPVISRETNPQHHHHCFYQRHDPGYAGAFGGTPAYAFRWVIISQYFGASVKLFGYKTSMEGEIKMDTRTFDFDILDVVKERWSPRAFDRDTPVKEEDLMGVMEAARYAPSCFNEQPWSFIAGLHGEDDYKKILGVLNETNREWASNAPVLMLITSRKRFAKNQRENRWHLFDAGTSWGYLSLEARSRDLHTHAMGGFNVAAAKEVFNIGDDTSIIAIVAMGYYGNIEELSPELQKKEKPGLRKTTSEILHLKGKMTAYKSRQDK